MKQESPSAKTSKGSLRKKVGTTGFEPSWRTSSGPTIPATVTSNWVCFRARRSDTPTRATARTRKEPTGEHPQAGSCQTAKDDGGKPGVRFLARSKRRKVSGPRRSSVERDKEGDGFVHLRWEETKEGDTVGGARLTIETGAGFPISISGRPLSPPLVNLPCE